MQNDANCLSLCVFLYGFLSAFASAGKNIRESLFLDKVIEGFK